MACRCEGIADSGLFTISFNCDTVLKLVNKLVRVQLKRDISLKCILLNLFGTEINKGPNDQLVPGLDFRFSLNLVRAH